MTSLTAKDPMPARVLEEYETGGGLVEIPILRASRIDLSRTAGGGKGDLEITEDDLKKCVTNFSSWPGPVPINVNPHRDYGETAGPAPGFIRGMRSEKGTLYATIFLCDWLWDEFKRGMWSGFSCDLFKNFKAPTVTLPGLSVAGGVFTNRPAADINFDLKAAAESTADLALPIHISYQVPSTASGEERTMSEEQVASLEAQLEAVTKESAALSEELDTSKRQAEQFRLEANRLRGENAELSGSAKRKDSVISDLNARLEQANGQLAELNEKLSVVKDANMAQDILRARYAALTERDVPAAFFQGLDEEGAVPWLRKRFVSLEALNLQLEAFPRLKRSRTVEKSGSVQVTDPDTPTVDPEVEAKLKAIGLSTDYINVTDEKQLKK